MTTHGPRTDEGCASLMVDIREEEDGVGQAQVKGVGGPAIVDTGSSVTMCWAGGGRWRHTGQGRMSAVHN